MLLRKLLKARAGIHSFHHFAVKDLGRASAVVRYLNRKGLTSAAGRIPEGVAVLSAALVESPVDAGAALAACGDGLGKCLAALGLAHA
jgi:hypothetical protein